MTYTIHVEVSPALAPYVDQVLARLRYLYPTVEFSHSNGAIAACADRDPEELKRDIAYQLYREKIYQEGLPMRQLMYRTLLS